MERSILIRRPNVICDAFDNEVVAVNMETGTYYSLAGSAAAAFGWLDQGAGVESLSRQLAVVVGQPEESLRAELGAFVDRMIEAGLAEERSEPPVEVKVVFEGPWGAPKVEEYTDMQDLLLLDPIHDVGQDGWPVRKEEAARD